MKQALTMVVLATVFTVLGLGSGWYAASQKKSAGGHEHGQEEEGGHEGHGHAHEKPALSPQALRNLGITVAEVDTTDFWKPVEVPAVVAESPTSLQPLYAPVGGRVQEFKALPGDVVPGGGVVVTLVRDPLPRPALALTDSVLKPANEDFHRAVGEARKARRSLEILRTEMQRVQPFAGEDAGALPVLPRKSLIDLRYETARAELDVQNAEVELRRHGCNDAQIAEIVEGKGVPIVGMQVWKQALQQNGLWPAPADALLAVLPADLQQRPWSIAAIGELSAAGISLADLAAWLKEDPTAAAHFLEVAGLMQEGHSLASVKLLHQAGGLEPVVSLVAPRRADAPDWDLTALEVKPGQRVEAGQVVATLSNPRALILRAEPVGAEAAAILAALREGAAIPAQPLVPGTGKDLKDLRVAYVTGDGDGHGMQAVLHAANEPLPRKAEGPAKSGRAWNLRQGLRYMLRVPTEKLEGVFVLPAAAVTDDGPDKVVYLEDGDAFKPAKVVVLYQDHASAVLDAKHSELFPGDRVVLHGAFGLNLALKSSGGAIDPHAGHNH
ncbi:MAG: efflux RND transporter periplasmic adaptor subunit [Planctomycetota bacterium]|nr:efflux RND transporter periplasmic adaptor subunit [Planctomycetota bacterium]